MTWLASDAEDVQVWSGWDGQDGTGNEGMGRGGGYQARRICRTPVRRSSRRGFMSTSLLTMTVPVLPASPAGRSKPTRPGVLGVLNGADAGRLDVPGSPDGKAGSMNPAPPSASFNPGSGTCRCCRQVGRPGYIPQEASHS